MLTKNISLDLILSIASFSINQVQLLIISDPASPIDLRFQRSERTERVAVGQRTSARIPFRARRLRALSFPHMSLLLYGMLPVLLV